MHDMLEKVLDRIGGNAEIGKKMAEERTGVDMDSRAQAAGNSAMRVVSLVVALTVGALIAAFLLPIGIEEITTAELGTEASSGASALWGILDVMIVLAVFLFFTGIALAATRSV